MLVGMEVGDHAVARGQQRAEHEVERLDNACGIGEFGDQDIALRRRDTGGRLVGGLIQGDVELPVLDVAEGKAMEDVLGTAYRRWCEEHDVAQMTASSVGPADHQQHPERAGRHRPSGRCAAVPGRAGGIRGHTADHG